MSSKRSRWVIYNRQMSQLDHGDALWEPAPLHNFERIKPGDVGYIHRGCFNLLFSAGPPLGERRLGVDVPLTFKQLDVGPILNTEPQSPGFLTAGAIREIPARARMYPMLEPGSSISFRLTGGQGAALLTKHPTYREDVQLERNFEEYTKENYDSWVAFARERGHPNNIEPVLVTGVDMTRDFSMISYSNDGDELTAEFRISAPEIAPPWGVWHKPGVVYTNCGPQPRRPPSAIQTVDPTSSGNTRTTAVSDEYTQCVFVRYYTVRKRLRIPRVIKAAAGPHDLGPGGSDDEGLPLEAQYHPGSGLGTKSSPLDHGGSSITSTGSESDVVIHNTAPDERDDFDTIADYVFQNSDADAVLIHHRDIALLREPRGSADLSTQLVERRPPVTVDKDGLGTIDPPAKAWPDEPLDVSPPAPLFTPGQIKHKATNKMTSPEPRSPSHPKYPPPSFRSHTKKLTAHAGGSIFEFARSMLQIRPPPPYTPARGYDDFPRPPLTNVGDEYAWRSADGSGNNVANPGLGAAGNPYARSVSQSSPLPRHQLPDPGLVFDTLLRREEFVPHPAGLSSLMFSFAALVVHSVFRTANDNVNVNETSSYFDLAPLYGINQEKQNKVRVRDGRGLLHPDVFSEDRLLLLPPAVCVLLVLFNRNHNYIAKKLLEINERGTWKDPDSIPVDTPNRVESIVQQEEEIFQTARLINCGWFRSILFSDYFSAILGLVRQGNAWRLDPFIELREKNHSTFEQGRGNVRSVEYNCLYRWHATTSEVDERWVEQLASQIFPGKRSDEITVSDFKTKLKGAQNPQPDATTWTFGGMQRGPDGRFKNEDIGNILETQTENPAGAFKARGTPSNMRWMEVMGIESARRWGCCSLNDFRAHLGLERYKTFLEWNPDPEIATVAEKLYGTVDHLELYVGLQAEDTQPVVEGAGLCPGYTISHAVLADTIALIRGDRLFTADFTPNNLTAWGFSDCMRSLEGPGFGSMLGRLFLRTIPDEFTENSIYAWFPLMTPRAMDEILTGLDQKEKYDFTRFKSARGAYEFKEYGEVYGILQQAEKFRHPFLPRITKVIRGPGFFLATDVLERGKREQRQVYKAFAGTPERVDAITTFFYEKTKALIAEESYRLVGGRRSGLDIVRDVFRVVPIQWVATQVAGITLRKFSDDTENTFTQAELFDILNDIYTFCFLEIEAGHELKIQNRVETQIERLMDRIETNVGGSILKRLSLTGFVGTLSKMFGNEQGLVGELRQGEGSTSQKANSILAVMVGASVELGQALTHMINIFLDRSDIALALMATDEADVLEGYVIEMLRIDPPVQGVYREAKANETVGSTSISAGDMVYLDVSSASRNERAFAEPAKIDHSRPKENYIRSDVLTRTLGTELVSKIVAKVLQAVFELKNVTRGPGQSGELRRFTCEVEGIKLYRYLDKDQQLSPWASSLVIMYDN